MNHAKTDLLLCLAWSVTVQTGRGSFRGGLQGSTGTVFSEQHYRECNRLKKRPMPKYDMPGLKPGTLPDENTKTQNKEINAAKEW